MHFYKCILFLGIYCTDTFHFHSSNLNFVFQWLNWVGWFRLPDLLYQLVLDLIRDQMTGTLGVDDILSDDKVIMKSRPVFISRILAIWKSCLWFAACFWRSIRSDSISCLTILIMQASLTFIFSKSPIWFLNFTEIQILRRYSKLLFRLESGVRGVKWPVSNEFSWDSQAGKALLF